MQNLSRRDFTKSIGMAAGLSILGANTVFGTNANSKINIGLIGCGGRGTWIAELFKKHGGYNIVAAADYFQDRVDEFGDKFNIPQNKRFTGLSCYKRLIESKVDAIVIESPPYFHPEQAAAGVDAGIHVYLAKPIAVDVPGCRTVEESGLKAGKNNQVFLIDFQTRANEFFIEALKRTHAGAIGSYAFGEATYHAGSPWKRMTPIWEEDPTNPENQIRAWGLSVELSGDIITEQNIHTLDVMNWIMDENPVMVSGTGGKRVRTDSGSCWDNYTCVYQYPNNVGIAFSSRQFEGHGSVPEGIRNRMFGNKGVLETEYGGKVFIRGENFYKGGRTPSIYQEGAENNIATFYDSIANGVYGNPTVKPSVKSNMITVMGRIAAREGRQVYWHQLLNDDSRLIPNLKGLKD